MKSLDSKFLQKFLAEAVDELQGDWVLIGGTLLPAVGIDHRVTTDIDLVPLDANNSTRSTLRLLELAEKFGLTVESINQAAAYFLEKIPGYKDSLVLLKKGGKGRIFRPDATLYLLLKIRRMTESDLQDCLYWLKWTTKQKEQVDLKKTLSAIDSECRKSSQMPLKLKHLQTLRQKLQRSS